MFLKQYKNTKLLSHTLWYAADKPPMTNNAYGWCKICGHRNIHGIKKRYWDKPELLKLKGGIVCEACQFAFDDTGIYVTKSMKSYCHMVNDYSWVSFKKTKQQVLWALKQDPYFLYIPDKTKTYPNTYINWFPGEYIYGEKIFISPSIVVCLYNTLKILKTLSDNFTSSAIINYGYYQYYDDIAFLAEYKHTTEFQLAKWIAL